jgi:ATP-dependent DNA ligase
MGLLHAGWASCLGLVQAHLTLIYGAYIGNMLWRVRNSRGRPLNVPAAFIHPCQPIVAKQPPSGRGWAHELKHDGYRLQIHVRE